MVQRRAMLDGARFARTRDDFKAAKYYGEQADLISQRLDEFWSANGFIKATLDNQKRQGLDCGVILASIHGEVTNASYAPGSDRMLATHDRYTRSMRTNYRINKLAAAPGVAVGRYSEDIYDGYGHGTGNPWYLCNAASAEQLYLAITNFVEAGTIDVTETSVRFFRQFYQGIEIKTYYNTDDEFAPILTAMKEHADTYMKVIQKYVQKDGSMSEQFNRDTGKAQGASDLTWSYVAFLSALEARGAIWGFQA